MAQKADTAFKKLCARQRVAVAYSTPMLAARARGWPAVRGLVKKNELLCSQDEGFSRNVDCIVDRGGQYCTRSMSVFARPCDFLVAFGSRAGAQHQLSTRHRFFPSVVAEQALCGARADGDAGR